MTDYGHPLLFGTFNTPTNQQPETVVALAQLAEQVGLDLVTYQDHPYLPRFFDTWTLMSYVAAKTETVLISGNVLNLPLRPPAMLARAAASLDILSDGRFEMGLGAGAFWDGIASMGGRKLSPKQGVAALREGIEIIRAIWDEDAKGGVFVRGEHHQVLGAKRGPRPVHDIGIWLGAYKPGMLRLVGQQADGWLPSHGYLQPGDLQKGNAAIDAAAEAAGRSPKAIRRLLNVGGQFTTSNGGFLTGPVSQWVEELAEMVINDGVSAFILASDDPATIQRFGEEVAPAVREMVELARKSAPIISEPAPTEVEGWTELVAPEPVAVRVGETQYDRLGVTPTPDSGKRLSTTRYWDEASRPTRGESDADVIYTALGRQAGKHLIDVHNSLREELVKVQDLIEQVKDGKTSVAGARSAINEMTLRQNNWVMGAYCANYCRVVTTHHTIEDDSIFPYLRKKEEALVPVIDRLAEEHLVIHKVLDELDAALVDYINHPDDFSALQRAMDGLSDTLLSHLSYEERELVEPLARYGFYARQLT